MNGERVEEIRRSLTDARDLCARLGLAEGAKGQPRGLLVRCLWHAERTPSCSVRQVPDGTVAAHCFGCGASGDVFDLVAAANGLESRQDFPEVLRLAADLAGPPSAGPRVQPRLPRPARPSIPAYPPAEEVAAFWAACRPVGDGPEVAAWLSSRGLDTGAVEDFGLARALPPRGPLPRWATFTQRNWAELGYRLLLPVFDASGKMRSLRARRVVAGDGPKNLAPAGYSTGGLVMADVLGRTLLGQGRRPDTWPAAVPLRIVVSEGEPDFLSWGSRFSDADATGPAVLGVVSGSWTPAIAGRIPEGARVVVRTDPDEAGERYARDIYESLQGRCTVLRGGLRGAA